jgi:hypothetical protein
MNFFQRLYHVIWYKLDMTEAYLAYMRGDILLSREYEMKADYHQHALRSDSIRKRYYL